MSETYRERAFDRFWRASDSHHDGTGLDVAVRLRPVTDQPSYGGRVPRSGMTPTSTR